MFRVQPSIWRQGGRVYRRGDTLTETQLEAMGSLDAFRRLGFVVAVENDPLDGMTKPQLVEYAENAGIDINPNAGKPKILKTIKEAR